MRSVSSAGCMLQFWRKKLFFISDVISATVWPAESRKGGHKIQYEDDNSRALDPSLLEGLKQEEEEGEKREIINNTA